MEFFAGLIILIAAIAALIFFKSTIKKSASYVDAVVTTNVSESMVELTERSMEAYQDLIDRCGKDFKTPQEIFDMTMKKRKAKKQNGVIA